MKKRIFGIETEYGLLVKSDEDFSYDLNNPETYNNPPNL